MTVQTRVLSAPGLALRFVLFLGWFLVLQGLAGGAAKVADGDTGDLLHNALHLVSGLGALWAIRMGHAAAARFAVGFGVGYLLLALAGLVFPRGLVSAALQLRTPDQIFHTVIGLTGFAVGINATNARER
ncbi:MAG TPA: DUF4383 domain-containing protein [Actinomycetota bacterium]|nr:DUF4383 domain-containing protein [Actinomycetota bacterium]